MDGTKQHIFLRIVEQMHELDATNRIYCINADAELTPTNALDIRTANSVVGVPA